MRTVAGQILGSDAARSGNAMTNQWTDEVASRNMTHVKPSSVSAPAMADALAAPAADQSDAGAMALVGCHQSACSASVDGLAAAQMGLLPGAPLASMLAGLWRTYGTCLGPATA